MAKTFNFKGDDTKRVGVIAQDLLEIAPEFVREQEDGTLGVSYQDLHSAEIAYLKQKIFELELWLLNNK